MLSPVRGAGSGTGLHSLAISASFSAFSESHRRASSSARLVASACSRSLSNSFLARADARSARSLAFASASANCFSFSRFSAASLRAYGDMATYVC